MPYPGLMELVEHDDTAASRAYLRDVFSRYDMDRVDAIVLGCTHYVFLKDMIREMVPPGIAITEGSEEGGVTLQTSGSENDIRIMKRLLQVPLQ